VVFQETHESILEVEDDRLPRFFYEEPLSPHNKVFGMTDKQLLEVHHF
jgi:hypothetical protein